MILRICPKCKAAQDERLFTPKPGGWCAPCREAFKAKMVALGERRKLIKEGMELVEASPSPKSAPQDELASLLSLAQLAGAAKQRALIRGRASLQGKRAWSVYYDLNRKLERAAEAYRAKERS